LSFQIWAFLRDLWKNKFNGGNLFILLMVENPCEPVEVGSLSHYLPGFLHARWCRIPSTISMIVYTTTEFFNAVSNTCFLA